MHYTSTYGACTYVYKYVIYICTSIDSINQKD